MSQAKEESRRSLKHRAFSLETWLNSRVAILGNRLTNSLYAYYSERFELSRTGWRILTQLAEFAPMSAKELGRRIAVDQIQISRACSRLFEQGLIIRGEDPRDRRRLHLELTPKGRKVYQDIVPVGQDIEQRVFSVLSAEELSSFEGMLTKIERRIQELSDVDGDLPATVSPSSPRNLDGRLATKR
jgi:DNA-binding MarR family transcriptional regulator